MQKTGYIHTKLEIMRGKEKRIVEHFWYVLCCFAASSYSASKKKRKREKKALGPVTKSRCIIMSFFYYVQLAPTDGNC